MSTRSEAEVLADMLDYNRKSTVAHFNKLMDADVYRTWNVEGKQLNSAIWIMGHLATTENYLCLRSTGAEIVRFSWAKLFGMGATISSGEEMPPVEEILSTLSQVHDQSLSHIRSLDSNKLDQPTSTGFKMGGEDSYRAVIRHAIFHEGTHCGHLTWLCKLSGLKTI